MALCAKFKFETDVFFMILRSKIMKNTSVSKEYWGCVKRFFPALHANLYLDRDVFFVTI